MDVSAPRSPVNREAKNDITNGEIGHVDKLALQSKTKAKKEKARKEVTCQPSRKTIRSATATALGGSDHTSRRYWPSFLIWRPIHAEVRGPAASLPSPFQEYSLCPFQLFSRFATETQTHASRGAAELCLLYRLVGMAANDLGKRQLNPSCDRPFRQLKCKRRNNLHNSHGN
jgi:hypothetical protein